MLRRRQKYGAVPTGGYASRVEADYAAVLRLRAAAGEITGLREQPSYVISPPGCALIRYRPDFAYVEDGVDVAVDVKGMETDVFRIKAKLFRWMYPEIRFVIVRRQRNGWHEEVQ
jgi:hypothetical protein